MLTPPDKKQCQAEKTVDTNFMTLGGPSVGTMARCTNKPVVIVTEKLAGSDGQKGSMSLCDDCKVALDERYEKGFFTEKKINGTKKA